MKLCVSTDGKLTFLHSALLLGWSLAVNMPFNIITVHATALITADFITTAHCVSYFVATGNLEIGSSCLDCRTGSYSNFPARDGFGKASFLDCSQIFTDKLLYLEWQRQLKTESNFLATVLINVICFLPQRQQADVKCTRLCHVELPCCPVCCFCNCK